MFTPFSHAVLGGLTCLIVSRSRGLPRFWISKSSTKRYSRHDATRSLSVLYGPIRSVKMDIITKCGHYYYIRPASPIYVTVLSAFRVPSPLSPRVRAGWAIPMREKREERRERWGVHFRKVKKVVCRCLRVALMAFGCYSLPRLQLLHHQL